MRLPQLHKILVAIAWAFAAGSNLSAATWDGGNGDWTSAKGNRWGLGVGQYPGDAAHGDETADLSAEGQVVIKEGDEIRQQPRGSLSVKAGTIKQTGGILISDNIHVRTRYDLLGGTVTGNGAFLVSAGGVWNVDGGELGTRVTSHDDLPKGEGAADAIFEFNELRCLVGVALFQGCVGDVFTLQREIAAYQRDRDQSDDRQKSTQKPTHIISPPA